jgi:lipoprotein-releasing system permease protein
MYKYLLCWRYLRTRWIALASVISVTLGVATMIVVNSVMAGFAREMQDRIHGILSDVVFEARSLEGFHDPEWHLAQLREVAGDDIAAMTVTVNVPAMLSFQYRGNWINRPITLIGIDENTQSLAGDFGKYLQHPENRRHFQFALREDGYDVQEPGGGADSLRRPQMARAGWEHRRRWGEVVRQQRAFEAQFEQQQQQQQPAPPAIGIDPTAFDQAQAAVEPPTTGSEAAPAESPFGPAPEQTFDPVTEQATGLVLGLGLSSYHVANGVEHLLLLPGDDVKLTFPTAGSPPKVISDVFTVVDFYHSKMSEYDSNFVFVPLSKLQQLRGMIDPRTGVSYASSIQIKLKDENRGEIVRDKLRAAFSPDLYVISTWRDKQGPLLAAVQMETAILNILLFMIIAVAGFGILAIFFMIVVEKTRDIGVLKSLGASSRGVSGIFLGYGLSLGMVGSGVGLVLGLLFVYYINEIADLLGLVTGQEVFDPSIYYFTKIPTIVHPFTLSWIVLGAVCIAVLASVLPARRAARLHPVEALRYE